MSNCLQILIQCLEVGKKDKKVISRWRCYQVPCLMLSLRCQVMAKGPKLCLEHGMASAPDPYLEDKNIVI